MSTVEETVPELMAGDYLTREEFLQRWEAMPNLKRAELIRGVVYMPSPLVGVEHGTTDSDITGWLGTYRIATPGTNSPRNTTWLMDEDAAPQPDNSLYVRPEYGGRVRLRGKLLEGVPEFVAETCVTSTVYDLHQKLQLYQESGVQEYLTVVLSKREVRWHRLTGGRFVVQPQPTDGIYRSGVFPGLWLDAPALMAGDMARVMTVLNEGIASPEHTAFVAELAARKNS